MGSMHMMQEKRSTAEHTEITEKEKRLFELVDPREIKCI